MLRYIAYRSLLAVFLVWIVVTLVFLMLCDRSADLSGAVSREGVALNIQNRRLGAYADGYLELLKSEARIVRY